MPKSMRARWANQLWQVSAWPAWRQFLRATKRVEAVQEGLLQGYLAKNRHTIYGERFNFATIRSMAAYQGAVPLTTYDDYATEIEAISRGKQGVLTTAPVTMFELSSGSTAASKLLPYTARLKAEFQRGIATWVYSAFQTWPHLKEGPAYWSITPLTDGRRFTSGGMPIGFEEDSAYLGLMGKYLVDSVLAVPNQVKYIRSVAGFRYVTLLFLLRRPDLRLMSVWNPTYLTLLLAPLGEWWPALIADIAQGTLTPPEPLAPSLTQALNEWLEPDPQRADTLASLSPTDYQAIWPALSLVSCWLDGPAAAYGRQLQTQFPTTPFQGKGLLATEAFVSLPISGHQGAVLALTSHFFEFLPVDDQSYRALSSRPQLAHRLDKGQTYAVVVTTGGGFYRYQLQDVVAVVGAMNQAPCLRFLGKTDRVSDWFGEKLNERFVAQVLETLFQRQGLQPLFVLLAPNDEGDQDGFCYTLYVELPVQQQVAGCLTTLALELDRALRQNFHYDYCRKLQQLAGAKLFLIAEGGLAAYMKQRQAGGQRLGDIKPPVLDKRRGWGVLFKPKLANK